jgi:hypothetical protein
MVLRKAGILHTQKTPTSIINTAYGASGRLLVVTLNTHTRLLILCFPLVSSADFSSSTLLLTFPQL